MIYQTKGAFLRAHIKPTDTVLDVGFVGQGIRADDPRASHPILRSLSQEVYGLDQQTYRAPNLQDQERYFVGSAENFSLDHRFDVIFAGDLIEHLSNPGHFLDRCRAHLNPSGRLIITTPNTFNLFNLAEKLSKPEPTVNADHTMYLNIKTLSTLLKKNGFRVVNHSYIYSLEIAYNESWKKKILNAFYHALTRWTDKFCETLCVIAEPI